jgi:hypothetical protein
MKNLIATTAVAATLVLGATATSALEISGVRIGNPFDSTTWWEGSTTAANTPVVINFADPDFWMSLPDPARHSQVHTMLSDPATWAQMMTPQAYINMVDPDVWMKWVTLDTYDILRDPATHTYWMQPGAYGHLIDIDFYTQRFNPLSYGELINAALGNVGMELSDVTDVLHLSSLFGNSDGMAAEATDEVVIEN